MKIYFSTKKYKPPTVIKLIKDELKLILKKYLKYDITLERRLKYSDHLFSNKKILKNYIFNNTMLTNAKLLNLKMCLEYVINNKTKGDIVECGVWKGGAMAYSALILKEKKVFKKIYLYDLFDHCPQPDKKHDGIRAIKEAGINESEGLLKPIKNAYNNKLHNGPGNENDVMDLLEKKIGYPFEKIILTKGYFQETLLVNENLPVKISLLRLDGDWYSSTKVCLESLYHLVVKDGIIIIDDYFAYEGCKKAVDEFLHNQKRKPLLHSLNDSLLYWIKN